MYNNDLVSNTNDPDNVEGILNTPIFKSLEIGEKEKVRVNIEFGDSRVTSLVVDRSVDIKKTDENKHSRINTKLQVFSKEGETSKVIEGKKNKT